MKLYSPLNVWMLTPLFLALACSPGIGQDDEDEGAILKRFRAEMVQITPGQEAFPKTVMYGQLGEQKGEEVDAPEAYLISQFEVTQNLWEVVTNTNPSRWMGKRNSVEMVTFPEAAQFCERLTERLRKLKLISDDQLVRLPTELEWEYAIRGGTATEYSFGNDVSDLDDYAWHTGNAAGNDPPVGAKKPNPWKLYDGHGYLWEYCLPTESGATKTRWNQEDWAKAFSMERVVVRGGSWKDKAEKLRSGFRRTTHRDTRDDAVGLRCVIVTLQTPRPVSGFKPTAQDKVVSADASLEWLWNEGEFTEGPAVAPNGDIYFSDIGNRMLKWNSESKSVTTVRDPSGRSNGMMFNRDGLLVVCEGANTGGGRRVSMAKPGQEPVTLSSGYQGARFNSPNDLVIDAKDRVYVTDPRYVGDEPRELDYEAVFIIGPDGTTEVATNEVSKPNGIVLSPDSSTAYVADHHPDGPKQLLRFRVDESGKLVDKKVLFDFGTARGIDGMSIDQEGNVFATAGSGLESGIYVFGPAGEQLAFIPTPGAPTNCVFGGPQESQWLYVTAEGPEPVSADEPRKYGLGRIQTKSNGFHVVQFESDE